MFACAGCIRISFLPKSYRRIWDVYEEVFYQKFVWGRVHVLLRSFQKDVGGGLSSDHIVYTMLCLHYGPPYDVQVDCVLCNCPAVIQPVSVNVVRVHDGLRTPDCTQCNHV